MSNFEEKALENPDTVITLAGNEYTFREPCKRDCTIWFARSMKIMKKNGMVEFFKTQAIGSGEENLPYVEFLEAIPEILDFLFDFLKIGLKERDRINNEFEIENIMACFNAIVERISAPFIIGKPEQNPGTQEEFPTS